MKYKKIPKHINDYLIRKGDKLRAIRALMNATGLKLIEAKKLVGTHGCNVNSIIEVLTTPEVIFMRATEEVKRTAYNASKKTYKDILFIKKDKVYKFTKKIYEFKSQCGMTLTAKCETGVGFDITSHIGVMAKFVKEPKRKNQYLCVDNKTTCFTLIKGKTYTSKKKHHSHFDIIEDEEGMLMMIDTYGWPSDRKIFKLLEPDY